MKDETIEARLSEIERTLHEIDKTLALNTQHLGEHMRRTELLEKDVRPVVKHVEQMRGAGKLLGILALIATIAGLVSFFR